MKTKELKNFNYFGISKKGSVRENNQDRIAYFNTINGDAFIVCDGMGGLFAGDFSAEKTTELIGEFLQKEWIENPYKLLENAIKYANSELVKLLKNNNLYKKSGTTVVIVLVRENRVFYAHAGDSRIYYRTGGKLFSITKDHSYVQTLIDNKLISKKEAQEHPRKNEITKAVGISEDIIPTICEKRINPADKDCILLCSDGFSSFVNEKEINKILDEQLTIKEKTKLLFKKADENGSDDNISIQLIHFYNTGNEKNNTFSDSRKKQQKRNYKLLVATGIVTLFILLFFLFEIFHKDSVTDKKNAQNDNKTSSVYTYILPDSASVIDTVTVKTGTDINLLSIIYKISIEDILKLNNKTEINVKPGETIIIKHRL